MALKCVDSLIQEHRLILRAVYVLEAMADRAKNRQMPAEIDVDRLLLFFRRFADAHHQAKEECVLFPALRRKPDTPAEGALHRMMFEHEQERSLIEGLEDALRTRKDSDFSYYGRRLADILGNHIYKEDRILFALVERSITTDDDAVLADEMAAFDRDLQSGSHEEMHRLVTDLERKYLGRAA
jgi:hemerythrin-like domain-containing protein